MRALLRSLEDEAFQSYGSGWSRNEEVAVGGVRWRLNARREGEGREEGTCQLWMLLSFELTSFLSSTRPAGVDSALFELPRDKRAVYPPQLWPVKLYIPRRHQPQPRGQVVGDSDVGRVGLEILDRDMHREEGGEEEAEAV